MPEIVMARWRDLRQEIGLRRAKPNSLRWLFGSALIVGTIIAWVIGLQTVERGPISLLMFGSLVLWQPAIEELLFRGVLQGVLLNSDFGTRRFAGVSFANLLTSIAFVLTHLVNHSTFWAIGVLFPSLLFGVFRDRSGSVWPPLLLHTVFNFAFFAAAIQIN